MANDNGESSKQDKLVDVIRGTIREGVNKRPKRIISVLATLGGILITAFVVHQSQLYIQYRGSHLLGKPLSEHVAKSSELRLAVGKVRRRPSAQPTPKVRVYGFDKGHEELINKAVDEVLNDPEAQKHFPKTDGRGLQETEVVIVPLWKFENPYDWSLLGITEAAYVWTKYGSGLNPEGVTIREKPLSHPYEKNLLKELKLDDGSKHDQVEGQPRMTDDGTPRVFLTQNLLHKSAFERLKFTLLHEFVHTHEVPGFELWPANFIHNDLTYLPAYCDMMSRLGLDTGKKSLEYCLIGSVPLFLLVIGWFGYLAWLGDRSL